LTPIADDIWGYEGEVRLPAGLMIPTRATVMRIDGGRLVIHSPLPIDDRLAAEIDRLGEVTHLIAPNCMHWMHIAPARYPQARVFGARGLEKKLGGVAFEALPDSGTLDGTGDAIRVERVDGAPWLNEHSFLHERSRSLLVADLMFNVHACRGFLMRLVFVVGGTWKRTAQSLEWRFLVKDRAAAAGSASKILAWDYERIVVAHGDVVTDDAREQARRALAWMTKAAPPLLPSAPVTRVTRELR
jgi:hypothetical protein